MLRVLFAGSMPQLEVDYRTPLAFGKRTQDLSGPYGFACADLHLFHLCIKGVVVTVLYKHALVIPRHYQNLFDNPVKDR
ncbi:hypothetical protein SDC9_107017 [bioreactor metagenome]|uniref:Uncharacterized protein n=1 Tax=bioreactor metagenome TaxID=1076179 RepID=A0A645B408_9ZZZZ